LIIGMYCLETSGSKKRNHNQEIIKNKIRILKFYFNKVSVGTGACKILLFFIFANSILSSQAQLVVGGFKDENALYVETKQVNQFIRRFNNEESVSGDRYFTKDSLFRNTENRKKYLDILFDLSEKEISEDLKKEFIKDISSKSNPKYLNFHGGKWFAQVHSVFLWQGKEEKLTLFLELEEEKVGSKWIISGINFPVFKTYFNKDSSGIKYFLHPMSHELEFMNLQRAFQDNRKNVASYTSNDFEPDQLSLFLYEIKKGNLLFKTIYKVKFHFFQIEKWYFEVSYFNRSGNNTGWLISNLIKLKEDQKAALKSGIQKLEQ
jgi:hypothetical protein